MSTIDDAPAADADGELLARGLDEIARSTPGVRDVYSARPVVTRAVDRLRGSDAPLTLVRVGPDGRRVVTVSVAVSAAADSGAVAGTVAAGIRHRLGDLPADIVRVRVSRLVP